ncbi:GNAT family N-acetyltransferase [Streptomyces sp. NPDC059850]|uniref:GNAT family N-acetyltransferase n=1 Tax=Streptomyces sp. NPDC059850 TaxID=3346970 RepID=UPI003646E71B
MVTLRPLTLDDAPALQRVYSGASVRYTTGKALTLDQAEKKIRTALARAAKYVVTFTFTTAGLDRVEAMHHPANPASGRVLTKAGFTRTGTSDQLAEEGTAVPYQVYSLPKR